MTTAIIVGSVAFTLLILVIVFASLRSSGALGMSRKQQAQAMQLMQTGMKARAWIMAIQPTGMVVNTINIQCEVHVRLEPLHGGQPIDVSKRMLLAQTSMPRIGDVWPAWYDAADPSQFVVAQPQGVTPEQLAVLREFGIPSPFDRPAR